MKHIINLLNLSLAFYTIFYTTYYVNTGDICKTILGCTMLLMWFWIFRKES
jgi:hypothetical protein